MPMPCVRTVPAESNDAGVVCRRGAMESLSAANRISESALIANAEVTRPTLVVLQVPLKEKNASVLSSIWTHTLLYRYCHANNPKNSTKNGAPKKQHPIRAHRSEWPTRLTLQVRARTAAYPQIRGINGLTTTTSSPAPAPVQVLPQS